MSYQLTSCALRCPYRNNVRLDIISTYPIYYVLPSAVVVCRHPKPYIMLFVVDIPTPSPLSNAPHHICHQHLSSSLMSVFGLWLSEEEARKRTWRGRTGMDRRWRNDGRRRFWRRSKSSLLEVETSDEGIQEFSESGGDFQ